MDEWIWKYSFNGTHIALKIYELEVHVSLGIKLQNTMLSMKILQTMHSMISSV